MQLRFEKREELAPGIWEYYFRPDRSVDFVPGQYVHLHLPSVEDDPRGKERTFTLTSLPEDELVRFVTKHFDLQTPYKHVLQHLKAGDIARIDDAMGDLVLPKSMDVPLVYVAGGIGMASFVSMLKYLLSKREERNVFLFYWLRSRREQLYRELTDAYPLALKQIVLAPNELSAQEIKATTPPDALIYLSGGQGFVEKLRIELESMGTPRSQIIFDYFDGYAEL